MTGDSSNSFTTEATPAYIVIVQSAGTGATGGGSFAQGATVSINAGAAPAGMQFKNWTASPAVSFASSTSQSTTFTMPAIAVTVTATFITAGGGNNNSGGSYTPLLRGAVLFRGQTLYFYITRNSQYRTIVPV